MSKLFLLNWGEILPGMVANANSMTSGFNFSLKNPINVVILLFGNVDYGSDVFIVITIFMLTLVLQNKGFS